MRNAIFIFMLSFLLISSGPNALAAPPANQLDQYLAGIGWSKQELIDYLNYYEMPLEGFSSVEDLKNALGTPINTQNLQALLKKYNLSQIDLNYLLSQFGDSLKHYKFIEDLDNSLAFYTSHDNFMSQIKSEMAKIGMTDQEVKKFFDYLSRVEESNKTQLDQMKSLDYRIEKFLNTGDPSQLDQDEIDELTQIFNQTLNIYQIQLKLQANHKDLTLNDLLKIKAPHGDLYTAIYGMDGEPLIDFTIPASAFEGVVAGWEELLHLGELANEYVDYLHNEKYNDVKMFK